MLEKKREELRASDPNTLSVEKLKDLIAEHGGELPTEYRTPANVESLLRHSYENYIGCKR